MKADLGTCGSAVFSVCYTLVGAELGYFYAHFDMEADQLG